jgi:TonB family protein
MVLAQEQTNPGWTLSRSEAALALLALGVTARLAWLAVGLWRLRRYRKHSHPWREPSAHGPKVLLSREISSPVTFGFLRPVILLPARFPQLDRRMQDAILCHERLHIERRDWLFTFSEELVRAVFWFHPAIWWLLGEIQLAREQAVDRAVVERTQARDEYVDALLAIAGAGARLDLAPAPLFLRRRHLKQRVVSILKEVRMSKTRWISGLAASLTVLAAACWLVTSTFPLAASPQVVNDAPGVTVDLAGAALLHRSPVMYPEAARRARVQGTVSVEVKLDTAGNVSDARVLSGPEELRKAAILSVFQWHFAAGATGTTRIVNIGFQLPAGNLPEPGREPRTVIAAEERARAADTELKRRQELEIARARLQELQRERDFVRQQPESAETRARLAETQARLMALERSMASRPASIAGRVMKSINVLGLSDESKADLLARLPIRQGDAITPELLERAAKTVREYDEHLRIATSLIGTNEAALTITSPYYAPEPRESSQSIKVSGSVQQAKLIRQARPVYPLEAKQAGISGVVRLAAKIAKDGTMAELKVLEGHPLLIPSALEAVRQWVYDTTLLNGEPVEIETTIDVNYTLAK